MTFEIIVKKIDFKWHFANYNGVYALCKDYFSFIEGSCVKTVKMKKCLGKNNNNDKSNSYYYYYYYYYYY